MADENVYVEKVLLGETTAEAVEKINKAITQINQNMDDIDEAGKVDEVQVNGTNAVVSKKVNFKNGTNVTMTASGGTVTVSSKDTKDTAGTDNSDDKLFLIGAREQNGAQFTYSNEKAYVSEGVVYSNDERTLNTTDLSELKELIGNLAGGMRYRGTVTATNGLPYVGDYTWSDGSALTAGDTLKVTEAGNFYVSFGSGTVDGSDPVHADVGDLFVLSTLTKTSGAAEYSKVVWTIVPSGDDGDVYSDGTWAKGDYLILSDGDGSTNGKKIKISAKTIGTTVTNSDNVIPTAKAVQTYVGTAIDGMVSAEADLTEDEILLGSGSKTAKASGYTISTSAPSSSDTTKIPTSSAVATALSNKTTNMVTASSTLTADQFLYGGGNKTTKASGLTKTTSISDADNAVDTKIPTEKAVRTLVDSVTVQYAKAVRIGSDTFTLSETITDENEEPKYYVYKSAEAYYGYIPVVVYNSAYQSMVIEMRSDVSGYVYLVTSPDEAIFDELRYVILNKVFPINS